MRWYRHLYMGREARKKRYRIVGKIRMHKLQAEVYVITLASNPKNLLDIYPANILLQPYYKKQDYLILGVAKGYEEALELVMEIIMEVYQKTGTFRLGEYFEQEQVP